MARYLITGSGFTVVDKHGGNALFVPHGKILDTSTDPLRSDWTVPPDAHTFRPLDPEAQAARKASCNPPP